MRFSGLFGFALVTALASGAFAQGVSGPVSIVSGTGSSVAASAGPLIGPCDILARAGTPCIAAHSVTRRLFGSYTGPLFQLVRGSDSQNLDIGTTAIGLVDFVAEANFCAGTWCADPGVYDQSGNGNILPQGNASLQAPWMIHPQKALPVIYTSQVAGYYRNRTRTSNIPTGAQSSSIYEVRATDVISGVGGYGRMENPVANCISSVNCPNGAMWALGYTNYQRWGAAAGVAISNGLGVDNEFYESTVNITTVPEFITLLSKYDNPTNGLTHKYGDVAGSTLTALAAGPPPTLPIVQNGISLGEGGDGSLAGEEFFEGAIISGTTSDATDNAIQANVNAFYNSFGAPATGPWEVLAQPGTVTSTTGLDASITFGGMWGLGRLRASYTGYAATLTRESDSRSISVGFTLLGDFDQSTAQNFCVGSTCHVLFKNQALAYHANNPNPAVYDMVQSTLLDQPTLVFSSTSSGLNSKPYVHFNGSQWECTASGVKPISPWALSAVVRRTGAFSTFANIIAGGNTGAQGQLAAANSPNTTEIIGFFGGATATQTASDSAWHSLIGVNNSGAVSIQVDGGTAATASGTTNNIGQIECLGGGPGTNLYTGDMAEAIVTGTAPSSAAITALYQNQHARYGGAF